MPNEVGCTLATSGVEEEALRAATKHAVDVHGHVGADRTNRLQALLQDVSS